MKSVAWIEGRAIDADSGLPVRLEKIVRCSFDRKPSGEVVLNGCWSAEFQQDSDGTFRLPYNFPDEYHLTLTAAGYQDAEAFTPPVVRLQPVNGIVIKMRKAKDSEKTALAHQNIFGSVKRDGKPVKMGWAALVGSGAGYQIE